MKTGDRTPWGKANNVDEIRPGIWRVDTPGHGGYKLSRSRNAQVPESHRKPGGWYEEDCDWSIPLLVFASEFNAEEVDLASKTAGIWHPTLVAEITREEARKA
jgi:hypothetical protein